MCRGDPTLATFFWNNGSPTSTQYSTHECINRKAFESWASDRMVHTDDYSIFSKDVKYPE